jgi:ribosome-binding protein aMBF1 (putative translation factor)
MKRKPPRESLINLKARQRPAKRNRDGRHGQVDRSRSRRGLPRAINVAIGEAITAARVRKGMTQGRLAVCVPGLYDAQGIYGIERGAVAPNLVQLRAIARALGTTIHALVPGESYGRR